MSGPKKTLFSQNSYSLWSHTTLFPTHTRAHAFATSTHIRVRSRFTHTPRTQTTRTMQSNSDVGGAPTKHTSTRHGLCHRTRECISALHLPPDTRFAIKSVNTADEAASCITWDYPALLPHEPLGIIDNWRGAERWRNADAISTYYGELEFEFADRTMSLREFVSYAASSTADCPYYLVGRSFAGAKAALLDDYSVPSPFADDCLGLIPGSKLARYWFVGGERSGTFLHVDPLCTSAWNTITCGAKRWCFLPPDTDIGALGLETYDHTKNAEQLVGLWFLDVLPRVRAAAAEGRCTLIECLQRPGDTVYVPAGWYHIVMNLELSIAISQNFHAAAALPNLWPRLSATHHVYSLVLRDVLKEKRPEVEATLPRDSQEDVAASAAAASQGDGQSVTVELPLHYRSCATHASASAISTSVVFVEHEWLSDWVECTPSVAACVRDGSAAPLFASYERLQALVREIQRRDALLVLVGNEGPPGRLQANVALLAKHGIAAQHDLARLRDARSHILSRWARANHISEWAVLRRDQRVAALAHAMATVPSVSRVQASISEASGITLSCAQHSKAGDVLLSVPLTSCILAEGNTDAAIEVERCDTEEEGEEEAAEATRRLSAKLRDLVAQKDDRAAYFSKVAPFERLASHLMVCWDDDTAVAERLGPMVAWQRAQSRRAQIRGAGTAAEDAESEERLWSACVVETRAIRGARSRRVLAPVVDLANHRSLGATASVVVRHDVVDVVARYTLDPGEEVTVNYDEDADFLDCFERFGFFDGSAVVHTAELVVPPDSLRPASGAPAADALISEVIDALRARGSDPAFDAWWLPAHNPDRCPLYAAVRASVLTAAEVASVGSSAAALERWICGAHPYVVEEAEARARLAQLVRAQLERYPTSRADDEADLRRAEAGLHRVTGAADQSALTTSPTALRPTSRPLAFAAADGKAALRLLTFEKGLLEDTLRELLLPHDRARPTCPDDDIVVAATPSTPLRVS